ncbi:MAG TPA: hypothetical protein DDW36_01540 [Candidatus Magasanikbacteria bacterium]|nr:hypothetical protein [Candidatus Magasanikbacteria bacterium]
MKYKIITLNMWHGGRLMQQALDFIRAENPDILCLQEVFNGHDKSFEERFRTLDVVKKECGFEYAEFAAAFKQVNNVPEPIERGNAVCSKFPLRALPTVFFDLPYDPARKDLPGQGFTCTMLLQMVEVDLGGIVTTVGNVHGIWEPNAIDHERRTVMANKIVGALGGKPHVVLAGDFNMRPDTQAAAHIGNTLQSIFKQELQNTMNMRRRDDPYYATLAVDMMFVSSDVHVLEHHMPDVDVSDHMPLVTEFELS